MTTLPSPDWWIRWPDRYRDELAAFERRGASVIKQTKRNGLVLLEVDWPVDGSTVRLRVGYSPLHPFCRPAVAAPDLSLDRHQNPFSRALCLLTQDSGQWTGREHVADLIDVQFPSIGRAIGARKRGEWEEAGAVEEQAPDPITTYYLDQAEAHSAIFFPGDLRTPTASFGKANFLCQNRSILGDPQPFEAVLSKVSPATGTWLSNAYDLPQRLGQAAAITGRWVRLPLPLPNHPKRLLELADAEIDRLIGPSAGMRTDFAAIADQQLSITGILVQEETGYGPDRTGDGWLFLASRGRPGKRHEVAIIAGHRVSEDMFSRLPIAGALRDKKALLVGCGAIGAPALLELARAGWGQVTFLDYDRVEPGNTVRWPLGRAAWGLPKVTALHEFLVRNYPFTKAIAMNGQVGAATTDVDLAAKATRNPIVDLRQAILDADVIIDASAATECQQALAFLARDLGRPLVVGYATEGVAGGVVARFPVGSPACLVCLHEHWADGTLPKPAVDEAGTVLPVGCNAPTFTGGAFDLQEVSLEIVRSAVGMVAPDAYDKGGWQLATLTLRDGDRRVLPIWHADAIPLHPRCGCAAAA
ncbi:ThiF family adenylyltransferase [Sphingomonas sp. GC_Shp_3]|uniref:ThiF family adenylyltransferase n=1 Tax=Sphingomonas sp. GC_Shp_3 TaxID=2937383 RepID=UPI002269E9D0